MEIELPFWIDPEASTGPHLLPGQGGQGRESWRIDGWGGVQLHVTFCPLLLLLPHPHGRWCTACVEQRA